MVQLPNNEVEVVMKEKFAAVLGWVAGLIVFFPVAYSNYGEDTRSFKTRVGDFILRRPH